MMLRKPKKEEFGTYKALEKEFYAHHKPYKTLLQDKNPELRQLKKEFLELIEGKKEFFRFLIVDDTIAGYVSGRIKEAGENRLGVKNKGLLDSIIVREEFRRKGLAKKAVQAFFDWLKKHDIRYVEASCNVKNKGARLLIEKNGFTEQHIKYGKILTKY